MKSWRLPGRALRSSGQEATAAADRRDRYAGRRRPAVRAAAAAQRLRPAPARISPERDLVRGAVRAVRDYRIRSGAEYVVVLGGSAFNVKAKSLRLGDFSRAESETLPAQRAGDTGRAFTEQARDAIWKLTRGQPWLVNALAYEVCFESKAGRAAAAPASWQRFTLSGRCSSHAGRRTRPPRGHAPGGARTVRYRAAACWRRRCRFGACRRSAVPARPRPRGWRRPAGITNPIYREVIPRNPTYTTQMMTFGGQDPAWYVDAGGALREDELLAAFQTFFASTRRTGWNGAATRRQGRSCRGRRSCSGS